MRTRIISLLAGLLLAVTFTSTSYAFTSVSGSQSLLDQWCEEYSDHLMGWMC